jgi:hypothetical protein
MECEIEDCERLEPIVQKLLAKPVEERYQSSAEICQDLKKLLKRKGGLFSFFSSPKGLGPWE